MECAKEIAAIRGAELEKVLDAVQENVRHLYYINI